jgi:hypothetical protein
MAEVIPSSLLIISPCKVLRTSQQNNDVLAVVFATGRGALQSLVAEH